MAEIRWEPIGEGTEMSESQQKMLTALLGSMIEMGGGQVASIGTNNEGADLAFAVSVALIGDELPVAAVASKDADGWTMSMHTAEPVTLCEICGTAPADPDQFHPVWHDDGAPMVACDRCVTAESEEDIRG